MNVLLINPRTDRTLNRSSTYFPAGLAYLASRLKASGFKVEVIDFQAAPEKLGDDDFLKRKIDSFEPAIIGIGCLFSIYFQGVKGLAGKIKKLSPKTPIVTGGLHPTLFCREILRDVQDIDFVVLGEGEESFLKLCLAVQGKGSDFESIDGLAFCRGPDIQVNAKTNFIDNLDTLPLPAFGKFDMAQYFYHLRYTKKNRGMSMITSRGCPNSCTFCSMFHAHGRRWRPRSAANVLSEIEVLYAEYGVRHIQFMDDNMTVDKTRCTAIFKGIVERGFRLTFSFPNGVSVNTLDEEVIRHMKEAGCIELRLAVESGSTYIRNVVMKKSLSQDKIFEVIELCNRFKIPPILFFVLGMPGENRASIRENIDFVKKLKGRRAVDFINPNFATPFPGTALFNQCLEEKLIDKNMVERLIQGDIPLFDKPIIRLPGLSEKELFSFRNRLWKITFRQNFLRFVVRYLLPTKANYRALMSFLSRFFWGIKTEHNKKYVFACR